MEEKQETSRHTMGIVIFLIFLVLFAVIYTMVYFSVGNEKNILQLDTINLTMVSQQTGENHNIQASFSVEGNKLKSSDVDSINNIIIKTLNTIDYDSLSSDDGMDNIKSIVAKELKSQYSDKVKNVYITEFLSDLKPYKPVPNGEKNQKRFDGLFSK